MNILYIRSITAKLLIILIVISFNFSVTAYAKTTLTNEEKLKDLNEFCEVLEKNQTHLYKEVPKHIFNAVKEEIKNNIPNLNDTGFYYELQKMAALSRDAHTFVNNPPDSIIEENFIPLQISHINNKWYLTASFGEAYKEYLSNELLEINGYTIRDILKLSKPYISYENNTRLENRFTQKINHSDFLQHIGLINDINNIPLTLCDLKGNKIKINVKSYPWNEIANSQYISIYKQPETKPDSNKIYDFFAIDNNTLFIRYNSSQEDSSYPLSQFTDELKNELKSKNYTKVIVDLRENTGGNYTLFPPTIDMIKQLKDKQNFKLYTLIGSNTFSSGVIHAAQLQQAGAILVGTPTSGNVYGYGDTDDAVELTNSHINVIYSTEYKTLVPGYTNDSLFPDIYVKSTINDYISGIDKEMETILNGADIYFK